MINEFDKPLIVFKEKAKTYHFYDNQAQLGLCNFKAIKDGFYVDMVIFTIYGNSYKILRTKIKKYRIWPLLDWMLASPLVELEFDFIPTPIPFLFEEFKNKLIGFIRSDSYFKNIGLTKEIVNKAKGAKNFLELSKIFDFIK